jgi:hypothetical protein
MNVAIITVAFNALDHRNNKSLLSFNQGSHKFDRYHFDDTNTEFGAAMSVSDKELYFRFQPHKVDQLKNYDAWVWIGNAYRDVPVEAIVNLADQAAKTENDFLFYQTKEALNHSRILSIAKNTETLKKAFDNHWPLSDSNTLDWEALGKVKVADPLPSEIKLRPLDRSINVFWHICMTNHYRDIIAGQLKLMVDSGLYDAVEKVFIGCAGNEHELSFLREFVSDYDKIIIQTHKIQLHDYEFPTLNLVEAKCKQLHDRPSYGLYIHTKGVTYPGNEAGKHWLDYMNHYDIVKWRESLSRLKHGYDLCGVKLLDTAQVAPIHYSGNFFWFDSEYVKTLKPVNAMNKVNRYDAEMWICSGKPLAATLCQKFVDYDTKGAFVLEEEA